MARFTREQLRDELQRLAHLPLRLTLTSNASSYISFTPGERPLVVRLQRLFLQAPDDVLVALGRWLGGRERSCPKAVRRFIDRPPPEAARLAHTRRRRLEPRGHCYDLKRLLRRVNDTYFAGTLASRVTWGRKGARRNVQARTLGSYYRGEDLIVIHPVLDQWVVPEWFVEFTVYHECLHALQGPDERPHNRRFNARLRRHPDYAAATRWEKANLGLLTRGYAPGARRQAAWRVERPADRRRQDRDGRQLRFDW